MLAFGRAMVDCLAYTRMEPEAWRHVGKPDPTHKLGDVLNMEFHFCSPTVLGYSFAAKKWGGMAVDEFTDINWNTNVFDRVMLSPQKKTLIESVMRADRSKMITDVLANKAGGFIVILHGKPGTGKTLTAEAIAEKEKKPLMIISAVELGYEITKFEQNLRNILEVC